ncbi:hypothetical protein TcasGA2_TC002203 [Tribolium castaneum]|uniref:Uncharacterized protein n=1 Tax=Tribolium castaneum TaxID=7070 RepID=D6WY71_TRICA|nr:hypothetical protein TcasGA2_TC002203 [Tribolium castaneum]
MSRLQSFVEKWKQDPRIKGWLEPNPENPRKARCSACSCELTTKLSVLLDHAKHQATKKTPEKPNQVEIYKRCCSNNVRTLEINN